MNNASTRPPAASRLRPAAIPVAVLRAVVLLVTIVAVPVSPADADDRPAAEAPAPRIVSLAPHLTELAFAAGAGEALVGVVAWSDFPAAARALPRIGDAFRFDLERIVRLGATHALAWGRGTPAAAIDELEALGIEVEIFTIERLEDIAATIEAIGALAGQAPVAHRRAATFRQRLARARQRNARRHDPPVSLFYQVSARPLFTLGARHVINDVFALCGARNLFADLDAAAASIDPEAVLARDPDAIVAGAEPPRDDTAESDPLSQWRAHRHLRAVACGNLRVVDPALLVRPTPRLLDGARRLCDWIDEQVRPAGDRACRSAGD